MEGKKPDYDHGYKLYLAGLSLAKVGERLGVTAQAVHTAFTKKGFQLRGPNFQIPESLELKTAQ